MDGLNSTMATSLATAPGNPTRVPYEKVEGEKKGAKMCVESLQHFLLSLYKTQPNPRKLVADLRGGKH